jgi:hypothetical protein
MLNYLKNLFNPTVGSLTSDIQRKVDALEDLAERKLDHADALRVTACSLHAQAEDHVAEARKAGAISASLRALVA